MAATPDTVHWRGVNHLALVTPDMDATVRFCTRLVDGIIEDVYRTGV